MDVCRCAVRDCASGGIRYSGEHGHNEQPGRVVCPSGNKRIIWGIHCGVDGGEGNLLSGDISVRKSIQLRTKMTRSCIYVGKIPLSLPKFAS